jgi:hypothetical protein
MLQIKQNSADKVFKTFPEFSQLTLNDRKEYEKLIRDYPPISDLSFGTLMSWWNMLDNPFISQLYGNLIVSYWLPGTEDRSGLAVIGTEKLDETICTIFDHQREKREEAKLVNVPEFVLEHIEHPELFTFKSMRAMDEYIVPVSKFYPLDHFVSFRRQRIRTFLNAVGKENIVVKAIDLSDRDVQQVLLDANKIWAKKGSVNDVTRAENEAINRAIFSGNALGLDCVGVFIDGELQAFCLYQLSNNKNYVILNYLKVNGKISKLFEYVTFALGKWFTDRELVYVNIDSDLGLPSLRAIKLAAGPINYFRKYKITPAK